MLRLRISSISFITALLFAALLSAESGYAQGETIRIRLLEQHNPTAITATAVGTPVTVYAGSPGMPLGTIKPGQTVQFSLRQGTVSATLTSGAISSSSVRLEPDVSGSVEIDVLSGKILPAPRRYIGTISLDADTQDSDVLRLINEVDLEEYVACVLPREYPFDDLEGSKAMAVVVRTYALKSAGKHGDEYDLTDHIGSQVYDGSGHVTESARLAAELTRGQVLTFRGSLIDATHFASSGGFTANNEDVWQGEPLPYLRAKSDPYDASPHQQWTSEVPKMQLLGVLTARYGSGKRVLGFTPGPTGPDGRVRTVRLSISEVSPLIISSNEFRLLVNRHFGVQSLKSTKFTVQEKNGAYVFQGSGYGHGVGLSQWGAHGMAERGRSYEEILSFYFTNVSLSTFDDVRFAEERRARETPIVRTRSNGSSESLNTEKRAGW